jgi:hypothetical protein
VLGLLGLACMSASSFESLHLMAEIRSSI